MTGKPWIWLYVLLVVGVFSPQPAPSAACELTNPVHGFSRAAEQAASEPLQVATPPQPLETDETSRPIASEAGRDYGLIIGAVVLVLIVLGGIIFSARQAANRKARD